MRPHTRYLAAQVIDDLARKMVFIAGARQVGKTTFARALPGARSGYLNWDVPADRERILKRTLPNGPLWVFDELHRFRGRRGARHHVDRRLAGPSNARRIHAEGTRDYQTAEGIRVAPAPVLLKTLA